jgi:hypothetical protein
MYRSVAPSHNTNLWRQTRTYNSSVKQNGVYIVPILFPIFLGLIYKGIEHGFHSQIRIILLHDVRLTSVNSKPSAGFTDSILRKRAK